MSSTSNIPEKGDIVTIELLQSGQAKVYTLVVLSPFIYNSKARAIVGCAIVAEAKGNPFEVVIPKGTGVEGVILSDHLHHVELPVSRMDIRCSLPYEVMEETVKKAGILLEL